MTQIATNPTPARAPVLHILSAPFRAYWRWCEWVMANNSRMQQVKRLQAMSDEELASHGLKREQIVERVFGPTFYA